MKSLLQKLKDAVADFFMWMSIALLAIGGAGLSILFVVATFLMVVILTAIVVGLPTALVVGCIYYVAKLFV